jgi:starch-binding outer membrane protein, SusD/RagB family
MFKKTTMKKLLILLVVALVACNKGFLDRAATTQQQDVDIFTNFTMTDQVINNLYSKIKGPYTYLAGYNLSSATDDAEDASSWMASQSFNNGGYTGSNNPIGNTWRDNYVAIRQANTILQNIKKYSTPDDPNNIGSLSNRVGEVFYLRAWFLSELIRQFGGVIIVNSVLDQADMEGLNQTRDSYDSCVAQIVADCDSAVARVQTTYPSNQIGRVTRGACMALKARMLLYSASPLWANAGKTSFLADIKSNSVTSDPAKWQRAAEAAKAVIDLGVYQLEPNLAARQTMFKQNTLLSPEVIWMRMKETDIAMDKYLFPYGSSGWSGCAPTQNLVDDYEMNNGLPISDAGSGYNEATPYVNRDPRFYTDISYNGASWKGRKIQTYAGGLDEQSTQTDRTRTGYFARKLADEQVTIGGSGQARIIHGIIFRLPELYLSYAEALNEYDPGNADIAKYVNLVRNRAGQVSLPAGLTQAEMRERIHHERRIELVFENHRFWDVRRWKIAETTQTAIYGMKPVADASAPDGYRYDRFKVEDRVWRNPMYVLPVTTDETLRNPNLAQNEGW